MGTVSWVLDYGRYCELGFFGMIFFFFFSLMIFSGWLWVGVLWV